ncbi:helix-turn-helix domain-containing protein [Methylosinus sp. Ce-a6]|uniref:winged helix-turn-helix transcriptional regulator n=1 Tax=Methylosinus sp. Ce-a6 TaxID=2172005 RepID=UPI00135C31C0|nr:helix-turn-helix domain-containing protein [Methylosinus sp. Ce-a6]
MRKQRHEQYDECPIEGAMDIIGGKWKPSILFRLADGTKRFSELQRLLKTITQRTLTQQLRDLERDRMISRRVYPEVPPRVEYSLTERGRSLEPVLALLFRWGVDNVLAEKATAARQAPAPRRSAADPTSAGRSTKSRAAARPRVAKEGG